MTEETAEPTVSCLERNLYAARGLVDDFDTTHFGKIEVLMDRIAKHLDDASRAASELGIRREATIAALGELHALVWGECPSLLNEDSGGDARLDAEIKAILLGEQP